MHEMPKMIENSLRQSAKIIITEHGISLTLLLGSRPSACRARKMPGKPACLSQSVCAIAQAGHPSAA
jgi:hypothetical protein